MKQRIINLFLMISFFSVNAQAQLSYENYEKGIVLKSDDASTKMKLSFRIQSLASFESAEGSEESDMKGMIRRMRLKTNGYVFDPKFEYKLEIALSNRDLGIPRDAAQVNQGAKTVLDAVVKYHLDKSNQLWFGQTKLPGNRERVISSGSLQFVDRSNVNSKFNIDRDFGVQYRLKSSVADMPLVVAAAVTTGEGRNITVNNEKLGMAYTGRLEVYPMGKFTGKGDYFGADLKREEKAKLAIGATYSFNQNTARSGGQLGSFVYVPDTSGMLTEEYAFNDISTLFLDMMFKYRGLSVMAEYADKQLAENTLNFTHGSGYVAQVGYLLKNNFEFATRFTQVDLARGNSSAVETTEYTFGISKYIVGHKLKVQSDVAYITMDNNSPNSFRLRFQVELGL